MIRFERVPGVPGARKVLRDGVLIGAVAIRHNTVIGINARRWRLRGSVRFCLGLMS